MPKLLPFAVALLLTVTIVETTRSTPRQQAVAQSRDPALETVSREGDASAAQARISGRDYRRVYTLIERAYNNAQLPLTSKVFQAHMAELQADDFTINPLLGDNDLLFKILETITVGDYANLVVSLTGKQKITIAREIWAAFDNAAQLGLDAARLCTPNSETSPAACLNLPADFIAVQNAALTATFAGGPAGPFGDATSSDLSFNAFLAAQQDMLFKLSDLQAYFLVRLTETGCVALARDGRAERDALIAAIRGYYLNTVGGEFDVTFYDKCIADNLTV